MAWVGTQVAATANNRNVKVWNMTKAADANAGPDTVAHGFGIIPFFWYDNQLTLAVQEEVALTADATSITITSQGVVGSAGGVPGVTVVGQIIAIRPSSLVK